MIVVHLHCVGTFDTRTGVKTLGWLQKTSTVLFSNCLPESIVIGYILSTFLQCFQMYIQITWHSRISCVCLTSLHCASLNVSSNRFLERRHSRIGCICLTFLHCASLNVSSNRLPGSNHWLHLFDFSQLCVFKCFFKLTA